MADTPVMNRIVCHFSCGAASAVATKLILGEYDPARVVIYNAFLVEEHPDNRRFLADCEKWFNHPITILKNTEYASSVDAVWTQRKLMTSPVFTPCSYFLKREVLESEALPGDMHVLGFTAEEEDRTKRFTPPDGMLPTHIFPLIDRNLSKRDCLGMIERAGIELPEMYRLGFNNANCIGCCRGGEGYWNKVRQVFPQRFAQVVKIEELLGSTLFRNRQTGERYGLKDLKVGAGRHEEILPDCSFFCAMAEEEFV